MRVSCLMRVIQIWAWEELGIQQRVGYDVGHSQSINPMSLSQEFYICLYSLGAQNALF